MDVKNAAVRYGAEFGGKLISVSIEQQIDRDGKVVREFRIGSSVEPGGGIGSFVIRNAKHIQQIADFALAAHKDFTDKFGKASEVIDSNSMHRENMKDEVK